MIQCRGWTVAVEMVYLRGEYVPVYKKGIGAYCTRRKVSSMSSLVKANDSPPIPVLESVMVHKRPIFPGFYKTVTTSDASTIKEFNKIIKSSSPYIGLFLSKYPDGIENNASNCESFSALSEIYQVGVIAKLINLLPNSINAFSTTAIIYPYKRIKATGIFEDSKETITKVINEICREEPYDRHNQVIRAICQEVFSTMADLAKISPFFREHITHHNISSSVFEDPAKLADLVAVLCSGETVELQDILESDVIEERLRKSLILLKKEFMTAQLQANISKDVEQKLNQRQRKYFLTEQLESIKKELGLDSDSKEKLLTTFREKALSIAFPANIKVVFDEEIEKLAVLEPSSAEFSVTRNYLDWLTSLPWNCSKPEVIDVKVAKQVLDEDHYGLNDVKSRILEFIAVSKLKGTSTGKILCLVGPPGVGKTSIGKSIAKALGRDYYRFSVGGLSDVAEIKGHRRTYVGAMPGKIIQALKRVKSCNPVILIDEIDKIGKGHVGDPTAALLEVLDPEQNSSFTDHYMDAPVDLSKVLFLCTANITDTIPNPLLDRMEIINLSGYVAEEKIEIAKRHLLPKLMTDSGINDATLHFKDSAITHLLRYYCRESGVRSLNQTLERICRKVAYELVTSDKKATDQIVLSNENISTYAGPQTFFDEQLYRSDVLPAGVVTGLAWTSTGGTVIFVETLSICQPSTGSTSPSFSYTGQLGKVMEESCQIAITHVKSFLEKSDSSINFFARNSVHLHVPEGATPKDGPSAGCTMGISLLSLAKGRGVSGRIAMTGELTLTGKILRIGGVREKVVAARRSGISTIILPKANQSDWIELPDFIKTDIHVHFVDCFEEVAQICGLT